MQSCRTVIIGGGANGLSVAYHLGLAGESDVLLLERHELTSGTSWHAAGIIGPLRGTLAATQLASYAPTCFRNLEQQTGQSTGYMQTGGLWLAQDPSREIEIRRIASLGNSLGFGTRLLSPLELEQAHSWINPKGIRSALWVDEDGQANPVDICMVYAKAARSAGITIQSGATVSQLETINSGYQITLDNGQQVQCEQLICCAGLWSRQLLDPLDVKLPLQAVEHMYVVTEAIAELPNPLPIVRDLEAGIYCKADAGKLVIGGFERNAKTLDPASKPLQAAYALLDEDWQQFEPFMAAAMQRFPDLENAGIRQFLNGPESFTHDTQPLLGPVPGKPGLYVAAGMNSLGIVSSAGVGKSIAEWLLEGRPEWDLLAQDVSRTDAKQNTHYFLQERMREAVATQFEIHWPYKQAEYARGAKRTPVHHLMKKQGAVFGSFAGWERPLWFAEKEQESSITYRYEEQTWWPIVRREAKHLHENCGLLDLSPFVKINISDNDALALMQSLCSREMDLPLAKACYCLILNSQAGIIADVTVTRFSENEFLIIAAAACRYKLVDWIEQQRAALAVQIQDLTTQEAVFGISGANSRQLMEHLTGLGYADTLSDFSDETFPFASVNTVEIGLVQTRVARLSFVSALGYEIYCPSEYAAYLYELILEQGQAFGIKPVGMLCVDACRMEKGFVHWGHDIGPNDDPLTADLMFAVNLDKATSFIGQKALQQLKREGVSKRRVVLEVSPVRHSQPLLLHDEPVYLEDKLVGYTTSGVVGGLTQLALCMAYVNWHDESIEQLSLLEYQIEIAGVRHPARLRT